MVCCGTSIPQQAHPSPLPYQFSKGIENDGKQVNINRDLYGQSPCAWSNSSNGQRAVQLPEHTHIFIY